MITNKHNGYTNYWTWTVAAWIDNRNSVYNKFHNLINAFKEAPEPLERQKVRNIIMHDLREYVEKSRPRNNSFWDSITNDIAKENINYYEIAETMLSDAEYPD